MKRLLSICLLLLAASNLNAQSLSAGMRANAGYWLVSDRDFKYQLEARQGKHMDLVPEVFVRYATKKKWAFEASVNRSQYSYSVFSGDVYDAPYSSATQTFDLSNIEYTLTAGYELSCKHLKSTALGKKLHSYANVSLSLLHTNYESNFYPDYSPTVSTSTYENKYDEVWAGIGHTLTYDVSKRLMLTSGAYVRFNTNEWFSSFQPVTYYNPSTKFGLTLGAAFRF